MKWSFSIAKVADIDVRVHATFGLLLAYWGYVGYANGGAAEAKMSVFFIMLLFLCVLLHEFGHALAARHYGIRTPHITLYPIGGVAMLARMPRNPVQELVIAIAGPMVNVAIALALWLALGLPLRNVFDQDGPLRELLAELMRVNVLLIAFNLIPAFPMDGGRVLRALLAMRMNHAQATRIAARTGQAVAVLLGLIGVFGLPRELGAIPGLSYLFGPGPSPFLVFIAVFVFTGAQQEAASAGMRAALEGLRVGDAMVARFHSFPANMPVAQAIEEAQHDVQPVYPITDSQLRLAGMVLRNDLLQAAPGTHALVDALAGDIPAARVEASFEEAFTLMQQSGSPVLPVVNPAGQIVGLVSLNLLSERAKASRA